MPRQRQAVFVSSNSADQPKKGNERLMLMHTLELIVLLTAGLATRGLMGNWVGPARAMAQLSPSTYVELHQNTNRTFDPYMPVVIVGAIIGGIVLAVASDVHTASTNFAQTQPLKNNRFFCAKMRCKNRACFLTCLAL